MTWLRIDDDFYDHPKIVAAGPLAIALHVLSMGYASRHGTDGFIPEREAACREAALTTEKRPGRKPSGVSANNAKRCSPDGIRTHDLFLERYRRLSAVLGRRTLANKPVLRKRRGVD